MQNQLVTDFFSRISPSLETLGAAPVQKDANPVQFSRVLSEALEQVNRLQLDSGDMTKAYELGDKSVTLPEVMIAAQKASVGFQAVSQVRNHLVQAYKDVMSMPI